MCFVLKEAVLFVFSGGKVLKTSKRQSEKVENVDKPEEVASIIKEYEDVFRSKKRASSLSRIIKESI